MMENSDLDCIIKRNSSHACLPKGHDTVNTDGWIPTQNAWKSLFPSITLIAYFLHIFIGIRDRAKRKFKDIFQDVATKFWDCYEGESRDSFSQRVRRLHEWCISTKVPPIILEKIRGNLAQFTIAYDFPRVSSYQQYD
jgi:hypothetical protein